MEQQPQTQPKIFRAANIPYIIEGDDIQMLFMQPSNPMFGGELVETHNPDGTTSSEYVAKFQLAKGKIEPNETAFDASLREAREEIGLFRGNVSQTTELGVFMGRTTVFVSRVKDKDMFGLPGEETGDVKWMNEEQFVQEGRLLHVPVVQAAVRLIKKLEGMN